LFREQLYHGDDYTDKERELVMFLQHIRGHTAHPRGTTHDCSQSKKIIPRVFLRQEDIEYYRGPHHGQHANRYPKWPLGAAPNMGLAMTVSLCIHYPRKFSVQIVQATCMHVRCGAEIGANLC
jgi:hypothetical protein